MIDLRTRSPHVEVKTLQILQAHIQPLWLTPQGTFPQSLTSVTQYWDLFASFDKSKIAQQSLVCSMTQVCHWGFEDGSRFCADSSDAHGSSLWMFSFAAWGFFGAWYIMGWIFMLVRHDTRLRLYSSQQLPWSPTVWDSYHKQRNIFSKERNGLI